MVVQINTLRTILDADASGYLDAMKSVTDANARVAASQGAVGATVEVSQTKLAGTGRALGQVFREVETDADKYARKIAVVTAAHESGRISTDELAKLTDGLARRYNQVAPAAEGVSRAYKLTYTDQEILRSGMINFIQTVASGGGAMKALETQFFQTAPALPALAQAFGLADVAGIAFVGSIGLLVGAFVGAGAAAYSFAEGQREVELALTRSGNATGLTIDSFNDLTNAAASAAGISKNAAREIGQAMVTTGQVSKDNIGIALSVVKDYAAFIGKDVPTAGAELTKSLGDPEKAAKALSDTYRGSLTPALLEEIHHAQASGDIHAAQTLLLGALSEKTQGAARQLSDLAQAWDWVSTGVSNVYHGVGEYLNYAPTLQQQIAKASAHLDDYTKRFGENYVGTRQAAAALADLNDKLKAQNEEAERGARQAAMNALGVQAAALAAQLDPTTTRAKELKDQVTLLTQAVANGGPELDRNKDALARVQHAAETLLDPTQALIQASRDEAAILAAPINQREQLRAKLEAERSARGQTITTMADQTQQQLAENLVLIKRKGAGEDLLRQLTEEIAANNRLVTAVGQGSEAMARAIAYNQVDAQIRAGKIPEIQREDQIRKALAKTLSDGNLEAAKSITQAELETAQSRKLTAAIGQGTDAVMRAQAEIQVEAQFRGKLVDQQFKQTEVEKLLEQSKQKLREAGAAALVQEKLALQADQDALALAQIVDPVQREMEEAKLARLAQIRDLTQKYGGDVEEVNRHLEVWDADEATKRAIKYWDAVSQKAEQVSGDVSQFLVDGFVNAEKGGKSAFENLWDGAWAGAKRLLANVAAEFLKTQFIMPIVTSFIGSTGSSLFGIAGAAAGTAGGAGGTAGGGGGVGGIMNLGSMFSSIGKFGSGALDWLSGASNWNLFGQGTALNMDVWGINNLGIGSIAKDGLSVSGGLSGILSGAGLGFAGGSIAQMLGIAKNGYGGFAGAAAGGLLASGALGASLGAVAGPIGLAVGLIASLFGPGKHHTGASATLGFNDTSGDIIAAGTQGRDTDIAAGIASTLNQAGKGVGSIVRSLGGKLKGAPTGYIGANDDGTYDVTVDSYEGQGTLVHQNQKGVKGSDTGVVLTRDLLRAIGGGNPDYSTGLSATARKVLTSDAFSAITDEKDLTAALDFIKQYDDAIKSISKDMSAAGQAQQAYQDALDSINSQFDNLEASATKFGLSIDELERGRTAQIKLLDANKQASDWLQATFGDGKLNLQLTKWGRELADAQNEVAKAGNAAANAYQNQRNTLTNLIQSLDQASSSLASTKDSLLTGSLSTLSGEEKQSLIAGKYFSTLNSALGGDATALGGLGQASTDYLQILKDNGASGELYARAFNEVVANLDKAQAVARTQSDVATKQLKRLDDSYQQLVDLVSRVSDVNVTLEGLPADIGTAFRAALEANDRLKVTSNGIVAQQKAQFDQLAGAYGTYRANGGTEAGGEQIFGGARDALLASISDIGALNDIGVKFYTGATSTESNALRARIIAGGGAPRFAMGGITSGLSIAGEAGPEAIVPLPGNRMIPVQLKGLPGVESKLEAMAHQIEGLARAMVSLGADQLTVLRAIGGEQRATRMAIENPA